MKKTLAMMLILISLSTFLIASSILGNEYVQYKETFLNTEKLKEDAIQEKPETKEFLIDWNYLKSINKDIVAWIRIKDSPVNYPILKDSQDLFYLKHSFNKEYNKNGSIFTVNRHPLEDAETVIYGHNMKNESMFSSLVNYLDEYYFNSHKEIEIYTPNERYLAEIFSVYSIDISTENDNIKDLDFNEKIDYYRKNSKIDIQTESYPSKVIKLSTCSYQNARQVPTEQRCYVVAGLVCVEELR